MLSLFCVIAVDMHTHTHTRARAHTRTQIVFKENFSAGKEGVTFLKFDRERDPQGTQLAADITAHGCIMQARSNNNQVIAPSFVVQEFEPEFDTAAEVG